MKLALLGLTAVLAQSCFVAVEDEHRRRDHTSREYTSWEYSHAGTLTLEWSVAGETHPAVCDEVYAEGLELAVYDTQDVLVDVFLVACADFGLSLELEDGWYSIDVTLIDRYDDVASTTLRLDDIDIIAGSELVVPIDFPPDSLF